MIFHVHLQIIVQLVFIVKTQYVKNVMGEQVFVNQKLLLKDVVDLLNNGKIQLLLLLLQILVMQIILILIQWI